MKQFDPQSIQTRFLQSLQSASGWTQIINDSGVISTASAVGESEAESVRYFEYIQKEAAWKLAQNMTSLIAGGAFLGYKPSRKVSALGSIIVTHDPAIQQAGITNIFTVADLATYLTHYGGSSFSVPSGSHFLLPEGTVFGTSSGIDVISTQSASYNTGDQYVTIPVIQGIQRQVPVVMLGNPFETIGIESNLVESANNSISAQFLSIYLLLPGANVPVSITIVEDIYLANYNEYACDVSVSGDYSTVYFRFGNGFAGALIPAGSTITINYLETQGTSGNITQNFTVTQILSKGFPIPLYCSNFEAISGGTDEDTPDTIRGKAPTEYLISGGSIVTEAGYKKAIESIPGIYTATDYPIKGYTDPVTGVLENIIGYSAITTGGVAPDSSLFPQEVLSQVLGANSPLDVLLYQAPQFLHLKLNLEAVVTSKTTDIPGLVSQAETSLLDTYGTLHQTFHTPFDSSNMLTFIKTIYPILTNVSTLVESVSDLDLGNFTPDPVYPDYFVQSFNFDPSYTRLRTFSDGVLHALKINIIFNCAECNYNGNSFSRTLFILASSTTPFYTVAQYPLVTQITSYNYMQNILLPGTTQILPSNTTFPYIPFYVSVNLTSWNQNPLGTGSISIPNFLPTFTGNPPGRYINFEGASASLLNSKINIQVVAQPFNPNITPALNNNIISINQYSANPNINDINVEVTYAS